MNLLNQSLVLGFEELQERPDGNVLECCVARVKEALEIALNASVGRCPLAEEERIITNFSRLVIIYANTTTRLTFR
jgi:hypothetical protein